MHVMGVIANNQVCEKGKGKGKGKEHSIHVGSGFHENGPWLPVLFVHERWQKNLEYVEWMIKTYLSFKGTKQTRIMSSCQWYGIIEIGSCAKDGNAQDLHFCRPFFDLCENMGLDLITFSLWIVRLNWANCVSHVVPTMTSHEWDGNGFMRVLGP